MITGLARHAHRTHRAGESRRPRVPGFTSVTGPADDPAAVHVMSPEGLSAATPVMGPSATGKPQVMGAGVSFAASLLGLDGSPAAAPVMSPRRRPVS